MGKKTNENSNANLLVAKQQELRHLAILSPLERVVRDAEKIPFTYTVGSEKIYISRYMSVQLLKGVIMKLELLAMAQKKDNFLRSVPFKYRESLDDPEVIAALPLSLKKKLYSVQCDTIYKILVKGRWIFKEKKFSKKSIHDIEQLLSKYKCGNLF